MDFIKPLLNRRDLLQLIENWPKQQGLKAYETCGTALRTRSLLKNIWDKLKNTTVPYTRWSRPQISSNTNYEENILRYSLAIDVIVIVLASAGSVLANGSPPHRSWPAIAPYSQEFSFPDGKSANASVIIKDTNGHPLYRLECHTFTYSDPDFDYSGDFECRLVSLYSKEPWSTLLTDDPQQTRDWQSRGRFLAAELEGTCGKYPEYGTVRHFRLRAMQLTLEISNFKLLPKDVAKSGSGESLPRFQSFRLHIKAAPDISATSEIAERPAVPESPCAYGKQPP
jgi:hypothetical protein